MPPLLMTITERLSPMWKAASGYLQRGHHWLTAPRDPVAWKAILAEAASLRLSNTNASRILATAAIVALLAVVIPPAWRWYFTEVPSKDGPPVYPHAALVNPVVAGIGAALLIWAAIQQAATARRRHNEQTDADRQRRITESYSKAVEQLAHDKIEVRLGGIYTLERISRESPDDYLTVMETLTAFVRERARWKEPKAEEIVPAHEPATDIAAVLAVIVRRPEELLKRERNEGWSLDLRGVDLRGGADLEGAHLEGAYLWGAHLENADLKGVHLKGARLEGAHFEGATLGTAHLESARLEGAHLRGAYLRGADLEDAYLRNANLHGADLHEANLSGADLMLANCNSANLSGANLHEANLVGANLIRADLIRANLSLAYLSTAYLGGASLSAANLRESDLSGADLGGAIGLSEQQLVEATGDAKTSAAGRNTAPRPLARSRAMSEGPYIGSNGSLSAALGASLHPP